MNDTIFAPATAAGRAAVAIVRLSGPRAGEALSSLSGTVLPQPRRAVLRKLRDAAGEPLDEALVLWMPAPTSVTGEDCVELHLHGGPAVLAAVIKALGDVGLRVAEPGEFTRRAFQNGRLDLAQAEAVGDLVAAETPGQRRQALAQFDGALSRRYDAWREALLDALALLEAEIDFPEDDDIPREVGATAVPLIAQVLQDIRRAAEDTRGERVREGYRIALIGAPNVGKSSLLNALVGRDAAIVTEIAGTTRDVVEAPMELAGQAVVLADTAGLRMARDAIEAEGVRRARAWASTADLRVGVADITRPETLEDAVDELAADDILVWNKTDLAAGLDPGKVSMQVFEFQTISTSAMGDGAKSLHAVLSDRVAQLGAADEFPAVTRARHQGLLRQAAQDLDRALADRSSGAELMGEGVRRALRSLERITGRTDPEAVLDRVFASFCIGK